MRAVTHARPAARQTAPEHARRHAAPPLPQIVGNQAVLRRANAPGQAQPAAPLSRVTQVLSSPGTPLQPAVRQEMEQRFGDDFSAVRVHADTEAGRSAEDVAARAYTVGSHVVFAPGAYAPRQDGGRRLLAHELAHVQQQRHADPVLRRTPPGPKTDVAIVLTDAPQDLDEGKIYAKTVLRVTDAADAVAKLKALNAPVGTLFVISHSTAGYEGQVQFSDATGGVTWMKIADLGAKLKGATTIDNVDFRGCSLGGAPAALENFRAAAGAQSAAASNCFTFSKVVTPLPSGGSTPITGRAQIVGREAEFKAALQQMVNQMVTDDKKSVAKCIEGLRTGEAPTIDRITDLYFANEGRLLARWASPDYNQNWQKGSVCAKDQTEDEKKPCHLVKAKPAPAPAAAPPP